MTSERAGWVLLVDWRDGSLADATTAIRDSLAALGVDADDVAPGEIQIDYGSRRVGQPSSPYFRAWVSAEVLVEPDQ